MSKFFTVGDEEITELIIDEAARVVERGDLVVMPTDTVYGIGADAFSASAVDDLLEAKRRGRDMPPPVLIPRIETLQGIATDVSDDAMKLAREFWPGPLTLICQAQPSLDWDLGDTHGTVGVRVPDNETALALLRQTGPLAVSSANLSGMPPAKTAAQARDQLDDSVALYLEAGELDGRTPSTIVDCTLSPMRVLRLGGLGIDELREIVPDILDIGDEPPETPGDSEPDDSEPDDAEPDAGETTVDAESADGESTDSEPADAEAEPADGEAEPADGEAESADSEPADGEAEPDDSVPADGQTVTGADDREGT